MSLCVRKFSGLRNFEKDKILANFIEAPQMDDAERVPSQKVQDLAEAVVSLTLQVSFHKIGFLS